jgi:hypothetical protein
MEASGEIHSPFAFTQGRVPPVPFRFEAGLVPEPIRTVRGSGRYRSPAVN